MTRTGSDPEQTIYTVVDDDLFSDLATLAGQKIVYAAVWEDSLADLLEAQETGASEQAAVDLDLYLADGVYFELYGALCYPSLEDEPLQGVSAIDTQLSHLVASGVWLQEVAVDEEDSLVLVLGQRHEDVLYLDVGAWTLDEWDEVPDG